MRGGAARSTSAPFFPKARADVSSSPPVNSTPVRAWSHSPFPRRGDQGSGRIGDLVFAMFLPLPGGPRPTAAFFSDDHELPPPPRPAFSPRCLCWDAAQYVPRLLGPGGPGMPRLGGPLACLSLLLRAVAGFGRLLWCRVCRVQVCLLLSYMKKVTRLYGAKVLFFSKNLT